MATSSSRASSARAARSRAGVAEGQHSGRTPLNDALLIPALLVVLAGLLLGLERWLPLRQPTRPLRQRLWVNLAITGLAFAVGGLVVAPVAEWTMGSPQAVGSG